MATHLLDDDALKILRLAAEEVSWLLSRGYPPHEVGAFVSEQRAMGDELQLLLAINARLGLQVKHHIARELDPEDVSRRPLRIDVASVAAVVAAGLRGNLLLENGAGLLCDPGWTRATLTWDEALDSAIHRCCAALKPLKPKTCGWLIERACPGAERLEAAVVAASKKGKLKHSVTLVDDVVGELTGAPFVLSSDPAIVDGCGSWMNLAPLALEGAALEGAEGVARLRLEG